MGREIEELARFVAETGWDDLPNRLQQHARLMFLDTLGVILAGSTEPEVQKLTAQLVTDNRGPATVFARGFPKTDPRTAALLNGIAGRTIELCEGHRFISLQGAVQIVPTVMAVGEQIGASGKEALAALVLGYEVAARIGRGVTPRRLVHQNGQWGLLGAVAAGARLRGFDAQQVSRAIRIGATLILTTGVSNATAGATVLNVAGGMAGSAGVLAPELALAGLQAQDDAVEEAFGQFVGDGFNPAGLADGLGERWECANTYFRLRACCSPIYAALDALEEILAEVRPGPDDVERIDVETFAFATLMSAPQPRNPFASRYSLPHAAAALVVNGNTGYASFTETALHNPTISALRQRVHISEDPAMTAAFPRLKPARVTVALRDGRRSTRTCESARGDFQRPYAEQELRAKFRDLAGYALTPSGVAEAERLLDNLERLDELTELADGLRGHSR